MDRIPAGVLTFAAVVFVGLAAWSVTDENWAGAVAGAVLAVLCVAVLRGRTS